MSLAGKVIAVTGGASGIGLGIARQLDEMGALVAIVDRPQSDAAALAEGLKSARAFHADVTDPAAMVEIMQQIVDWGGRLDGAVNNAGLGGPFVPTVDYPLDWWDRIISVNLNGTFYSLRAEIPHLVANGGGAIVNMASICGFVGQAGTAGYVATKHAVIGLTKNIALEYGAAGVRCNAVCPTYVRTPLTLAEIQDEETWAALDARHPIGHCASVEDVAAMTIFLLGDGARSVTGSAHLVDGGLIAS
ncbi:SDR family NAD(P)-dependent oxidoreductase [Novosphingobium album (ex Hu et al. 2023)]|uniref:SDR family oxidoreductase n=1 Tax=Novosphingobium album (ex Hu et al. 2023) TaxID=2930093 RepID=A0ABT0AZ68_9SPHN|nr:SDR family NAD(P)-dependent oxidoreductase [Novosphingobium album (ex Hu et al. 2023)]MCJ2178077.1 SDR family oxidoreductase [Novosphingobium album (ex Hu et al. 2023)]